MRVSELGEREARELGPLLRNAAAIIDELLAPEQVYVSLWSHAGGEPVHIHYVVQPINASLMRQYNLHGPWLQAAMFDQGELPAADEVERFAERARRIFSR